MLLNHVRSILPWSLENNIVYFLILFRSCWDCACNHCWSFANIHFLIDFAQASIFYSAWTPMVLDGGLRKGGGLRLSLIRGFWTSTAPLLKGLVRGLYLSTACLYCTARLQAVCLCSTSRLRAACHRLLMSLALACIVAPSMWKPSMMMLLSILQYHSLEYVPVHCSSAYL
jgi:hypothetical protein